MKHRQFFVPSSTAEEWTLSAAISALRDSNVASRKVRFLQPDATVVEQSYAELIEAAERVAASLLARDIRPMDRLGIIVPEERSFIVTFLGAVMASVIPVPMYPPVGFRRLDSWGEGTGRMLANSGARAVVTSDWLESVLEGALAEEWAAKLMSASELEVGASEGFQRPPVDPDAPVFLQYTSGSTARPRGVVVTHRSLGANLAAILRDGLEVDPDRDLAVSWLPMYHDMGLIGMVLAPLCCGLPMVYFSPMTFIRHSRTWLEAISTYRGTLTFAPNFALALTRRRVRERHLDELDLSSLRVLGCGAEPIDAEVLREFGEHFASAGFAPEAIVPAYGLAEATLAVSFDELTSPPVVDEIDADSYVAKGRAIPADDVVEEGESPQTVARFVSCGRPLPGHKVRIVDEAGCDLPERVVGEVVVDGPSVARGYFDDQASSKRIFGSAGLRTGDLGYLADGALFVTGRKKDVVILNGRNYDPQSFERVAERLEGVRRGNVVAFSVPKHATEGLVLIAEAKPKADKAAVASAIERAVCTELSVSVHDVRVVEKNTIAKTSSGKRMRGRMRELYLDGAFEQGESGV